MAGGFAHGVGPVGDDGHHVRIEHAAAARTSISPERISPCPPVWVSMRPARTILGPCACPSAMERIRPLTSPPRSRTVVKPALDGGGGEPSHVDAELHLRPLHEGPEVERGEPEVHVPVDQSREDETAGGVDVDIDVTGVRVADVDDDAVLDHDDLVLGVGHRGRVEHSAVPDDRAGWVVGRRVGLAHVSHASLRVRWCRSCDRPSRCSASPGRAGGVPRRGPARPTPVGAARPSPPMRSGKTTCRCDAFDSAVEVGRMCPAES